MSLKPQWLSYQDAVLEKSESDKLKKEVITKTTDAITKDIYDSGKKETILKP